MNKYVPIGGSTELEVQTPSPSGGPGFVGKLFRWRGQKRWLFRPYSPAAALSARDLIDIANKLMELEHGGN